ncbi:MAG TPA: STAS/SEC14 domain-containing protein [Bacteroidales bacterium]|nr:STAS/SEC14 domain-containing protein [Bacteroidales bacterium]
MEQRARFIEHKGKQIYYVDYSNLKNNDEFLSVIAQTNAYREKIKAQGRKDLLMLVDISGSFVYGEVLESIKRSGKITKELTAREAVVGITGSKRILLKIVQTVTNMNFRTFDTVDEAKDWLVS